MKRYGYLNWFEGLRKDTSTVHITPSRMFKSTFLECKSMTSQEQEEIWCGMLEAEDKVTEAIHILDAVKALLEEAMSCLNNCSDDYKCLVTHDGVEKARRMVINVKKYLESIKEKYFDDP
jgi:hypothetical protein